jgi:hypothetical protein
MSFKNELTLTEDRLKTAAKYLKKEVALRTGEKMAHTESLQLISHALFSKPFEEVKALMARVSKFDHQFSGFNPVTLYGYGSEVFLVNGSEYVNMLCIGTDMEISFETLRNEAENLSRALGFDPESVRQIALPEILSDEYETDDVLKLAEYLGYTRFDRILLDKIESADFIFIDDRECKYRLNDDWIGTVASAVEGQGIFCSECTDPIWFAETHEGHDLYEYFFTLSDIVNAKEVAPNEYVITSDGIESTITLVNKGA